MARIEVPGVRAQYIFIDYIIIKISTSNTIKYDL